jgi:hypothetical protein
MDSIKKRIGTPSSMGPVGFEPSIKITVLLPIYPLSTYYKLKQYQ